MHCAAPINTIHLRSVSITRLLLYAYAASLVATRLNPVMPSAVLHKAYCMPGNFYAALGNISQTFTLLQLHICKCLMLNFLSLSRMGQFSPWRYGSYRTSQSRGYGVVLQYIVCFIQLYCTLATAHQQSTYAECIILWTVGDDGCEIALFHFAVLGTILILALLWTWYISVPSLILWLILWFWQ